MGKYVNGGGEREDRGQIENKYEIRGSKSETNSNDKSKKFKKEIASPSTPLRAKGFLRSQ